MRFHKSLTLVLTLLLVAGILAGCGQAKTAPTTIPANGNAGAPQAAPVKVKLGLLPIIDALPFYVAQDKGYFKEAGLDVELLSTQSAAERDQAFMAGAIDGGVSDSVGVAMLINGGGDAKIASQSLSATPAEGRFAILVSPKSTITKPEQLKGVPVGISSNSTIEYVTEKMLTNSGLQLGDIKYSEVAKIPVRLQMLAGGQLQAATLPDPLISLAVKQGAKILLEDDKGPTNLTQSVVILRGKLIQENPDAVKKLLLAYGRAVADINLDPQSFRAFMVEKKLLPEPLKDTYQMTTYPLPQLPKDADFAPVLEWMKAKKLVKPDLTLDKMVATGLYDK